MALYIIVNYENDDGESSNSLINTDGMGSIYTNHDKFYLILKNNGLGNFAKDYEMHITYKEGGHLDEVYSYLRLSINGIIYNINDYIVKEESEYYFKIPIVNVEAGSGEKVYSVYLIDRAGNTTSVYISHTQVPPSIELMYKG